MNAVKTRLLEFYEKNELKVDIAFFLGGFFLISSLFRILTILGPSLNKLFIWC